MAAPYLMGHVLHLVIETANIEEHEKELEKEYQNKNKNLELEYYKFKSRISKLSKNYKNYKITYDELRKRISEQEEDLECMTYGVYRPHFTYQHSDEFKEALLDISREQKEDIKYDLAWSCSTVWSVGDSLVKGRTMTKRQAKLMLRAFNGECDAAMVKVTWNNATIMKQRIQKSFNAINKLGKSNDIEITETYLEHKLKEFQLHYELKLKIHEEKEEQRQIREAMREEAKLQKDVEKATKKADQDRANYERALRKARKDLDEAGYIEKGEAERKVSEIQAHLDEAIARKERALSQAQLTRAGHVYIISNIGCFGEEVFKIGMTRRLDPSDRIRELGGASVPFPFDVHGMVYSDNAPGLENTLHRKFSDRRINMVNLRKEFFNVTLSEIQDVVQDLGLELKLTKKAEAQQYRETSAILAEMSDQEEYLARMEVEEFPAELLENEE
ncbi:DUF4041 domain-containing protein [Modicisalibacter ilicicola]|uniref:DUF4041 domain-containing protein n=1 Tax=Modicisalibacter ilicicola TaxID=480814 RepID=UPI000A06C07B|nr:DUF4041 domain-containing protein [Halomonas ilicicola]